MIFSLNGIESVSDAMISAWGYGNEGKNCHVSVRAGRFVNPFGPPTGLLDVHRGVGNAPNRFVQKPGTFPAPNGRKTTKQSSRHFVRRSKRESYDFVFFKGGSAAPGRQAGYLLSDRFPKMLWGCLGSGRFAGEKRKKRPTLDFGSRTTAGITSGSPSCGVCRSLRPSGRRCPCGNTCWG
jgi:hypothetical protein